MAFQHNQHESQKPVRATAADRDDKRRHHKGAPPLSPEQLVEQVSQLLEIGHNQQAFDLINARGSGEPVIRNARAVCCLRLGQHEQAVRLLRELVVHRGRVDLRDDIPVYFKVNYATALLLAGNLTGGAGVVWELRNETHPRIAGLEASLRTWEKSLSFGQRLLWKFGFPLEQPVEIEFLPGVLS